MLGKFTWKDKADSRLDLTGGHGGALGDTAELASLRRDLLEGIGNEIVNDDHTFLGDTSLWVNLLWVNLLKEYIIFERVHLV